MNRMLLVMLLPAVFWVFGIPGASVVPAAGYDLPEMSGTPQNASRTRGFRSSAPRNAPQKGASARAGAMPGLFIEAPTFPAGVAPIALAAGDFNRDGNLDVVTANAFGNNVSVLLGNGDGTFLPPKTFATEDEPVSIAVGDFNGDGILDLAVANECGTNPNCSSKGSVSILLGNGDGTFRPRATYSSEGLNPVAVVAGDFNNDGKLDLAVVNTCGNDNTCERGPGTVVIFTGNGNGTFKPSARYAAGYFPMGAAVGDFNGDGNLDLAFADTVGQGGGFGHVGVRLGNGNGTFQDQKEYNAGSFAYFVAVGDFNGDGHLDLAVADQNGSTKVQNGGVSVLPGNGKGEFGPAVVYQTGAGPRWVATGDFNGDGIPDLITANNFSGFSVSVLLGDRTGTLAFQPNQDYGVGTSPSAVVVGNFTGSGHLDAVAANFGDGTISFLKGNGDGTFVARRDFGTEIAPVGLALGDFNGDGKTDVATANGDRDAVSILLGRGDGTFAPYMDYATGGVSYSVAVGDFNGDGIADLVTANEQGNSVSVLLGNGDGTFQPYQDYPVGVNPFWVAVGDFNGDGKLDLVTADYGANSVSVLLGNGDGTFQPAVSYPVQYLPESVAVADFNGDGKLDLAVANSCTDSQCKNPGTVSILLGNGDGTFQPATNYSTGYFSDAIAVGDLNGDGKLDLAVVNLYGLCRKCDNSTVSVLLGNGDGTFQPQTQYLTGLGAAEVAIADVNGDGKLDLATGNCEAQNCEPIWGSGSASILLGNGDGTFQPHIEYQTAAGTHSIAVGDFTGNGAADIVTGNEGSFTISVLLNTTPARIALTSSPNPFKKGQAITFTATVVGSKAGKLTPTGSVIFEIGSKMSTVKLKNGLAMLTMKPGTSENFKVTAHYSGDGHFAPMSSDTIIRIVNP
jgi:hypothetical protein